MVNLSAAEGPQACQAVRPVNRHCNTAHHQVKVVVGRVPFGDGKPRRDQSAVVDIGCLAGRTVVVLIHGRTVNRRQNLRTDHQGIYVRARQACKIQFVPLHAQLGNHGQSERASPGIRQPDIVRGYEGCIVNRLAEDYLELVERRSVRTGRFNARDPQSGFKIGWNIERIRVCVFGLAVGCITVGVHCVTGRVDHRGADFQRIRTRITQGVERDGIVRRIAVDGQNEAQVLARRTQDLHVAHSQAGRIYRLAERQPPPEIWRQHRLRCGRDRRSVGVYGNRQARSHNVPHPWREDGLDGVLPVRQLARRREFVCSGGSEFQQGVENLVAVEIDIDTAPFVDCYVEGGGIVICQVISI